MPQICAIPKLISTLLAWPKTKQQQKPSEGIRDSGVCQNVDGSLPSEWTYNTRGRSYLVLQM